MKIIGASVVFVCDRDFSIIRDGGVAYEGERIVEVGVYDELVAKYTKSPTTTAASAVSRNDDKNTQTLNTPAQDSRIFDKNAEVLQNKHSEVSLEKPTPEMSPSDSKILELESGFCEPRKEIRLAGLSTQCGEAIYDSSPKAESLQTEFFSGCVLLPALINAHIHFEFSSNSTSFVYGSFEGWLASVMSKRDDVLADMDKAIESTIAQQLDSGVGSVGAISSYGADMQALAQSALKVVYFSEAIGANPAALDMLLADFKARFFAAKELASRSFFPAIALHAPYSVHSVLAKHIIAFAKEVFDEKSCIKESSAKPAPQAITNPCETSCTFSAHFLESNAERLWLESKNDADAPKGWFYDFYTQTLKIPRPAPYYTIQEFMELFSSTRASFVHCTALNSLESTFLAQGGHSLITCPRSNRLLDGSMLDLKKLDSRQNLGIGTDGASSNANTNMLDELRAGLFGMGYDLQDLARVLLLAATRGGAKALGLANGTLESGRSADMAVFAIDGIIDSTQPEVHFILLANKVHRLLINGEQVR
ncbi:amidohydrolase family protein [Helicobacter canis]|uniref:Amidohydrolase-related domain-containing protein n=1 Tax=Helicobacter canis NCTC 12740 TaxID=1357399 RepID=V8CJN2_9HELI|nr:amidohydrolase family protein [Helicobacter canis]ETD27554.1 hypothetical protein HMPREF2087_00472 [Helicobacter canis NCTC 12740]